MLCIFCGEDHPSEHFICELRQTASIDRIMMLSARQLPLRQPTILEVLRRSRKPKKFLENLEPIEIKDSGDEEENLPSLSPIQYQSFLDTLDSDDELSSPIVGDEQATPTPSDTSTSAPSELPSIQPIEIASQKELEAQWPCIQNTINDPVARSKARTRASLKSYIEAHINGRAPSEVTPTEWMSWVTRWAIPRGRCQYADKSKGISPASAKIFFKLLIKLVEQDYGFSLLQAHPFLYKFPRNWQKTITKERRYERKQAGFFSQEDVALYIRFLTDIVDEGNPSDTHYAAMARVVISISMLFAGCRLGELLSAKLGQVQFVTVRGKMAVAITSTGTKSDTENQRSSPITFGTLNSTPVCPMGWFADWIRRNNWTVKGCHLTSADDVYLFPLFTKRHKFISTNYFTCKDR